MTIASRWAGILGALLVISAHSPATAQAADQTPTFLDQQLSRIDFAITGVGEFSKTTDGKNYLGQNVNTKPSNTLGYMGTLRYTKSPWVGGEFTFQNARYTENFTITNTSTTVPGQNNQILGIQTNVVELSLGYVVHAPRTYFGVLPFASGGVGGMLFRPTPGGGQALPHEGVKVFYASVGAESLVTTHFGLRAGVREAFFLQPDFFENYLRNSNHTSSFQPYAGVYVHF